MELCDISRSKLDDFVRSANPTSLHPLDVERWAKFMISVYENSDRCLDGDMREYFDTLESKRFDDEVINFMVDSFNVVLVTLKVKDTGRGY